MSRARLIAVVVVAIVLRLAVRLSGGEQAFLTDGYTFYLDLARSAVDGHGLCDGAGLSCADRMPLYPLFLALFVKINAVYPAVVIVQAAMGGAMAALAWWIGGCLFTPAVGALAAIATAVNPYAVVHDTSLQDTTLVNLLMLGSLAALLHASRARSAAAWFGAGTLMALAMMTSARTALFVPAAMLWILLVAGQLPAARLRAAILAALPVLLMTGVWMARNAQVVGVAVLTTESGEALYLGNGPLTFTHFPRESIDLSASEVEQLPPDQYRALEALEGQDVARDRLAGDLAMAFMREHPVAVVFGAARKLWVVASGELSPAHGGMQDWGYRALFAAVNVLALVGAYRARPWGADHALAAVMFLTFAATTALYWAHTSHKSYLDPVLFVYAAAGIMPVIQGANVSGRDVAAGH